MLDRPIRIGVIGAGIIGMSCAYRLQTELPNAQVTVVAAEFSPNLTSDGAAGVWELYDFYNTEPKRMINWAMDTYEYLKNLCLTSNSLQAGVSFLKLTNLSDIKLDEMPWYATYVENFRRLTKQELEAKHPTCVDGYAYTAMTCEPRIYLPWITNKFTLAGGRVIRGTVLDLSQFCDRYDLVINCTGLMASQLVTDTTVYPCRGQLVKVKGVDILGATVHLQTSMFVIPGRDRITMGGTFENDNHSTEIDVSTKEKIIAACCKLEPSLKNAKFEADWCGLRPARKGGVRLQVDSSYHSTTKVIHNYGHGGVGITLHWGCAGEVLRLANECLNTTAKSKL